MRKWLQRIIALFQGNDGVEHQTEQESNGIRETSVARSKSVYPKDRGQSHTNVRQEEERPRKFRFPVIPDQPKKKKTEEKPHDSLPQTPYEQYKERREQLKEAFDKARNLPEDGKPSDFHPSEIISPVYGKIDPLNVEEEFKLIWQKPKENVDQSISMVKERERGASAGEESPEVASVTGADIVSPRDERAEEPAWGSNSWTAGKMGVQTEVHMPVVGGEERTEAEVVYAKEEPVEAEAVDDEEKPIEAEAVYGVKEQVKVEAVDEDEKWIEEKWTEEQWTEEKWIEEQWTEEEALDEEERTETEAVNSEEVQAAAEASVHRMDFQEAEMVVKESDRVEEGLTRVNPSILPASDPNTAIRTVHPFESSVHRPQATFTNREAAQTTAGRDKYILPPTSLLHEPIVPSASDEESTWEQKRLLEETLANFNVNFRVTGIVKGPSVTRFELQPSPGVKVNKITALADDIKLNLAAKDIRIEAPIPGRNAVGIEVPNRTSQPVYIRQIIESRAFQEHPSPLAVALGMDIGGEPIVADIKKMPHGLIAGATGSGKSVCINSIIVSLLYKATPEQVRLLLIDPKMVELAPYNHLPHLVTPVVTDAKHATAALKWAVEEMEKRYALFVEAGVRDIERYNQFAEEELPYIVIIIDELADLMMVAPQDVEDSIIRIAQKARACGIHLLLATQRPSVDVITGNIKANVPTRLAFAVFSQIDSRTILDQAGAERLLGRGDMLFLASGATPIRLQGNFVSDDEIERVTDLIKRQRKPEYLFSQEDLEQAVQSHEYGDDELYYEALVFVAEQGQASASGLQRRFRIGYNRAARLVEMMEADGYVSGQNGSKGRTVLITVEDARAIAENATLL